MATETSSTALATVQSAFTVRVARARRVPGRVPRPDLRGVDAAVWRSDALHVPRPGGPPSSCGTPLTRIAYGRYTLIGLVQILVRGNTHA